VVVCVWVCVYTEVSNQLCHKLHMSKSRFQPRRNHGILEIKTVTCT